MEAAGILPWGPKLPKGKELVGLKECTLSWALPVKSYFGNEDHPLPAFRFFVGLFNGPSSWGPPSAQLKAWVAKRWLCAGRIWRKFVSGTWAQELSCLLPCTWLLTVQELRRKGGRKLVDQGLHLFSSLGPQN